MTHTALVMFAPLFTVERFDNPKWRSDRCMYYPGALKFLPGTDTVPLLVDHDEGNAIGTVTKLSTLDWTDGPWIYASATLDDNPPSWLKRGTPASFGSRVLDRREVNIRGNYAEVVADALVSEVSVLSPAKRPAEPRAQVLTLSRTENSPAARTDRTAVGEVFYGDGTTITRHFDNAVLAVGGRPVRRSPGSRNGDYIVDHEDGSSTIYSGPDGYQEALRDGVVV